MLGVLVHAAVVLVATALAIAPTARRRSPPRAAGLLRDPLRLHSRRPTTTARPSPATRLRPAQRPGNVGARHHVRRPPRRARDASGASCRSSRCSRSPARWPASGSPRPAWHDAHRHAHVRVLLVGVIVLVGALTFFPAFLLGPVVQGLTDQPLLTAHAQGPHHLRRSPSSSSPSLLGLAYPLAMTGVAQVVFPGKRRRLADRARRQGRRLAARSARTDLRRPARRPDPRYFQPRPSATGYSADATFFTNPGPNQTRRSPTSAREHSRPTSSASAPTTPA